MNEKLKKYLRSHKTEYHGYLSFVTALKISHSFKIQRLFSYHYCLVAELEGSRGSRQGQAKVERSEPCLILLLKE